MKNSIQSFAFILLLLVTTASCRRNSVVNNTSHPFYAIQSIFSNGKISSKFIYDNQGKLIEDQTSNYCNKYIYDSNNRLLKQEMAIDSNILSSISSIKTELMTSQHAVFSQSSIFEYNAAGQLITIKNYKQTSNQFEMISSWRLAYKGNKMVRKSLAGVSNTITQFFEYEYDGNGNVSNEKYFSFLSPASTNPTLIREVSYKYDNKNNPFIIFKNLGNPSVFTNPNNMLEANITLYGNSPSTNVISVSKYTYIYNNNGFPIQENNGHEYKYE